jgi:hypothetical protein
MNGQNNNAFLIGALLILSLFSALPAFAHHSVQAQFDIHETFTAHGTVATVEWINHHSYLTVNFTGADGTAQKWAFEPGGPGALRAAGMGREDRGGLKPGDELTASGLADKDGSTTGSLQELQLADGSAFKFAVDPNGNST